MTASQQDRALQALAVMVPPEPLSARARARALEVALATAVPAAPRGARLWIPGGLALAAAAAALIAWVALGSGDGGSPRPAPRIALVPGAATAVGHAQVRLGPGGVAWAIGDGELELIAGRVDVEVDPTPHRRFRVVTAAFAVDVLGTVFAVELDGVEVQRGAVRVTAPSGAVLVERLGAGQRWSAAITASLEPPPTAAPTRPEPAEIAMDAVDVAPRAAPPSRSAQAWLADARTRLAGGDIAGARARIRQGLAAHPSRSIRADAESLIAESYLRDGEVDTAITHFRGVADRYRDLATGEAALFAAARYEAKTGHADAARRLYDTYLERYPRGSLATQARAQRRALGAR